MWIMEHRGAEELCMPVMPRYISFVIRPVSCKYKPKYGTLSACACLVDLWCKLHPTRPISEAEKFNGGTVKYLSHQTVNLVREG